MIDLSLIFLLVVTVLVFYYDIRSFRIPNWITFGSWILYALYLYLLKNSIPWYYFISSLIALFSYIVVYLFSKGKLGMGDVKLSLFLGGLGGIVGWYFTNLFATIIALGSFLLLLCFKRVHGKSKIPFGPFLCIGAFMTRLFIG